MQIQYQIHGFIVHVNWTRLNKIFKIANLYLRAKTEKQVKSEKKGDISHN